MNIHKIILVLICISVCGCSDGAEKSSSSASSVDTDKLMEQHDAITKKGILADFVESISDGKYDQAFMMLHPKLSKAGTKERFVQDWQSITNQLLPGLAPEPTGSFSGRSPQGPYTQATYRLESNWRSTASLDLVSMQVDGKTKVVKIHIRMPSSDALPEKIASHANSFAEAMLKEDYKTVQNLFSKSTGQQYTPAILGRIKPLLGDSKESTVQSYYRLCANSVWYDVVLFQQPNSPAQHLELIMQNNAMKTEIVSLTFKGRM